MAVAAVRARVDTRPASVSRPPSTCAAARTRRARTRGSSWTTSAVAGGGDRVFGGGDVTQTEWADMDDDERWLTRMARMRESLATEEAPARTELRTLARGLETSRLIHGVLKVSDLLDETLDTEMERHLRAGNGAAAYDVATGFGGGEAAVGRLMERLRRDAARGEAAASRVRTLMRWGPAAGAPVSRRTVNDMLAAARRMQCTAASQPLDLVQLHWADHGRLGMADTLCHLADARDAGAMCALGVTNYNAEQLYAACALGTGVATNQVALSLVDRRVLREVSDVATEGGVALVGYGVLCGGLLHERWVGQLEPAPTQLPRPSQRAAKRALDAWGDWAVFQGLLAACAKVGRKHHTTVGAVALRWALQQPGVAAVSVGCRLGAEAFDADGALQAAADGAFELDAADLGVLDDAWARGRDLLDVVGDVGVEFAGGRRGW